LPTIVQIGVGVTFIIILKFRLNLKKNAPPITLKSRKDGF
jgi:hypothetical protein